MVGYYYLDMDKILRTKPATSQSSIDTVSTMRGAYPEPCPRPSGPRWLCAELPEEEEEDLPPSNPRPWHKRIWMILVLKIFGTIGTEW